MFDLAIKDLNEHRVRTILTTLGIIIAITAIVSLGSISAGIGEMVTSGTNIIGSDTVFVMKSFDFSEMSGPPTSGSHMVEDMDAKVVAELMEISGVERTVPVIVRMMGGGMMFEVDGIDMDQLDIMGGEDVEFNEGWWPDNDDEGAAIGYPVAEVLGVSVGDYIEIEDKEVEIMGIFEENSGIFNLALIIPFGYAEEIYDTDGGATQVMIEPEDISLVEEIKERINEDYDDIEAMTMEDALEMMGEVTVTLNVITFGIGGVASIVAAIGIVITMYTSVLERKKQIGIMKAVGAERGVVMTQILQESVVMAVIGCAVGLGISFFFVDLLNGVLLGGSTLAKITPALAAGAVSYGIIITLISSLYPAWIAVRTDPIDAIRNG